MNSKIKSGIKNFFDKEGKMKLKKVYFAPNAEIKEIATADIMTVSENFVKWDTEEWI